MKTLTLLIALLLPAYSTVQAAGPLGKTQITGLSFFPEGLVIAGTWKNPNNCSSSSGVLLQVSDPNYDKAYSLVLAAYMSGKKLSGYSNECIDVDGTSRNMIRGYKYLGISD